MKEKELYKVSINYVNKYGNTANEVHYMKLDEGEKKLLYWLENVAILSCVDMYAINEIEIVEF